MKPFYRGLIHLGNFLTPFLLLAIRLYWGYQFYLTGIGKLQNPAPVIEYFTSLGIPLATPIVYLSGAVEMLGGAMLILGLGARLAAIPLIAVMLGAYFTAHNEAIMAIGTDPETFIKQDPFNFLFAALIIFCFGPGLFSLDAVLKKLFYRRRELRKEVIAREEVRVESPRINDPRTNDARFTVEPKQNEPRTLPDTHTDDTHTPS